MATAPKLTGYPLQPSAVWCQSTQLQRAVMLKPCFSFRQRSNTRSHMACLAPWGWVVCGQAVIVDVDVMVVVMVWVRVEAGDVCRGLKENLNNMVGFACFWYLSCV